jgi:hypothetical protein
MQLTRPEADQVFRLHHQFMHFVNQQLQIDPSLKTLEQFKYVSSESMMKIRNAFLDDSELITSYVSTNPYNDSQEDLEFISSWRHRVSGKFYMFRQLKKHMVFLTSGKEPAVAYGVLALAQPFEDMMQGARLPILVDAILLPYKGQIIYDGLLSRHGIYFGGGMKRLLNETYKNAKERFGIVTSLPLQEHATAASKPPQKAKPKKKAKPATDTADVLKVIVAMTDEFCDNHLNDEYAQLCRKLAEKLSRKRPSPLVSGNPATWACGIVRTVGWVNFLDDRSQKPHMKLPVIDKAFGVAQSTGQGKSKLIRKMLKIRQFDYNWTLPSKVEDSPMTWMVKIDGFIMDIRKCPRELQEAAFRKGLIPYVPQTSSDPE